MTYLPAYLALATLSALASRRLPALRPVAACFGTWAALDAATGPLWLRAGVFVAWPGVAVVAAAWGLGAGKDEGPDPFEPSPSVSPVARLTGVQSGPLVPDDVAPYQERQPKHAPRPVLWQAMIAVYLLAGIASALTYRAHAPALYHVALPCSRALPVLLAALALASRRYPRTWAQRAAVLPAAGLVCGVVLGVWALLPAGLESVREQWGRLAGGETAATMVGVGVCVGMAWREARRNGKA